MTEKQSTGKEGFSADWFLRGALTRIGDTFDRFTGRRWTPSSSLATSELIERLKRLLDSEAVEVAGKGTVVPHNIKLKVQWDKFSTDSDEALEKLENELLTAAADHINDNLFYTHAPLRLEVKPDYFTQGVKLYVSFDKFAEEEREAELNVTIPAMQVRKEDIPQLPEIPVAEVFIARFSLKGSRRDKRFELPPGGRITVGRNAGNDLRIDDLSISKIHAAVVLNKNGLLSVADTGSTNGTFVNAERIAYGKAIILAPGDKVKFGSVEVVFDHVKSDTGALSKEETIRIDTFESRVIAGQDAISQDSTLEIDPEPAKESTK